MILGQSAGTAAALSIDDKCSIQALPYAELARQLRADGQNLDLPESDLLKPDRKIKDLAGIVVDDEDESAAVGVMTIRKSPRGWRLLARPKRRQRRTLGMVRCRTDAWPVRSAARLRGPT